jgi:tetratricopeptide (TPR) repeat protein
MVRMRCQIAEDDEPGQILDKLRSTLSEHLLDADERRFVERGLAQLLGVGESETAERQELFAAWRLFFERLADSNPTVLVFEDLQWADASLLDFVEYLLEWSRSHPLYVITLARPELLEKRPTWGAGQRSFTSIYLEPLREEAMDRLLGGLVPGLPQGLKAQILERAEGVPLYAVETVRMLLDRGLLARDGTAYQVVGEIEALEVPETLHALIAARLDGLSEEERKLLQDAAVLGKTFSRKALAALAGADEDQLQLVLEALVRKEVLSLQADPRSPEHGQYGFLQDLVRRVAYETLSRRDRKSRHLAAASAVSASFDEEEMAEVIAAHLLAAYKAVPDADDADELKARAAAALIRAGERAASLAAAGEAQRYFEQAGALVDTEFARAELADRAGVMAVKDNHLEEARTLLERAHASYEQLGEPAAAARVASVLADIDFVEGHPPRAVERLEPALAALEAAGSEEDVAAVAGQLGRFLFFSGEDDRALAHLERALSLAELHDQTETLAEALNTKSTLFMSHLHRPREAQLLLEGALEIALEHDLHSAAFRAYNNLSTQFWVQGRWQPFLKNVERALEAARRAGDRRWESQFLAGPVGTLAMIGRWDEALARAAEAEAVATYEFARGMLIMVAPVHIHRGDVDRVRELLSANEGIARSENAGWAALYALTEGMLHAAEGRHEEALAAVDRALALRSHFAGTQTIARFDALEIVSDFGDEQKLRELLAIVDELPPVEIAPYLRAQQARFRARLPEHDTEAELLTAEQLFAESETPFYLAVTRLERGRHLLESGRIEEARPLLDHARETFEGLRARPWLDRVEAAESQARVPS